jgi:hypothetical protein
MGGLYTGTGAPDAHADELRTPSPPPRSRGRLGLKLTLDGDPVLAKVEPYDRATREIGQQCGFAAAAGALPICRRREGRFAERVVKGGLLAGRELARLQHGVRTVEPDPIE